MSVYTLFLFLFYLLVILLATLFLITLFPIYVSVLSNVDGFYYDATINFSILLGLLNASTDLHPEGGTFKLFVFSFPIYSTNWTREEKAPEEKEPDEKPIDKPKKRKRDFRILIKPIKRLFDASIRIIKVKKLDVTLITGLSDPYVSGLIFGVAYPFIEMMRIYFPFLSFSLTPVFVEERFKARVCGSISFIIILFLVPLLRFFLSKEYWKYRK
ncbi:MAG: hypothetical protein ACTSXX_05295 [Candidatus Baldrarchaeia archaeon]